MSICAIVVAFHPDPATLARLCSTLLAGGAQVAVVDNSEPGRGASALPAGCHLHALGANMGIAHAQNVGIATARALQATLVLFLDQDSSIGADFVQRMADGVDPAEAAVYGPVCIDAARGFEYPSYRLSRLGLPRPVLAAGQDAQYEVDLIISSGSLATAAALEQGGGLDESFFIDYVDLEWCLRLRARGIPIRIKRNVTMTHSVGMRSVRLGPITTFIHSPARTYYKMRNPFLLLRKRDVARLYALREIASALLHHGLQLLMLGERARYAGPVLAGLLDGVRGTDGARRG